MTESHIEKVTAGVMAYLKEHGVDVAKVDLNKMVKYLVAHKNEKKRSDDKYPYLTETDVKVLSDLVSAAYSNPFIVLDERRTNLDIEIDELPQRKKHLEDLRRTLLGRDYSLIQTYEANDRKAQKLKEEIDQLNNDIETIGKRIIITGNTKNVKK